MPNYEYNCKKCGHLFDRMTRISAMDEATKEPCPSCHESAVERMFPSSAPSIGDAVRLGIRRPDEGFKDVLRKIHDSNPGSNIKDNSRYI